tara:strand:- start:78 stop:806 length:729 start_codon:yes stop_codon:yes gene_type:complete
VLPTLYLILLSTLLISLIAFIGIITLSIKERLLQKILLFLVALSAGTLIGNAFLHLLPEALKKSNSNVVFIYVLIGFVSFLLLEKILHWHHCHDGKCTIHSFAYINLLGDSVHNFLDGLIIAASFLINIPLGFATTLAILFHEIPQELGDFGVLIHGGFSKVKALFLNFITAVTAVLGGITGYLLSSQIDILTTYLIPFAAGGFIYISASDLLPEIKNEMVLKKCITNLIIFIIGILIMYLL